MREYVRGKKRILVRVKAEKIIYFRKMCLRGSMEGMSEVETGCAGYWLAVRVH